jgi:putative flippase GtrA
MLDVNRSQRSAAQFVRFIIVGLASNAVLYLLYLAATSAGVGHKTAMTILYFLGVLQTFLANRTWSFRYRSGNTGALVRYLIVYLLAYLLNLGVMYTMVDRLGYSDKLVQGGMVVIVAVIMFLSQKLWVFRSRRTPSGVEPS